MSRAGKEQRLAELKTRAAKRETRLREASQRASTNLHEIIDYVSHDWDGRGNHEAACKGCSVIQAAAEAYTRLDAALSAGAGEK